MDELDNDLDALFADLENEGSSESGANSPALESKITQADAEIKSLKEQLTKVTQQNSTMQGQFQAFKAREDALKEQNTQFLETLQAIQQANQRPDPATTITEEELDRFGETLQVAEKQTRRLLPEALEPYTAKIAELQAQVEQLMGNQQQIVQQVGDSKSELAMATLRADPDFIASQNDFAAWRQQTSFSGGLNHETVWQSHLKEQDVNGLGHIWEAYKTARQGSASPAQQPQPRPTVSGVQGAAPSAGPNKERLEAEMGKLLKQYEDRKITREEMNKKRDRIGELLKKPDYLG